MYVVSWNSITDSTVFDDQRKEEELRTNTKCCSRSREMGIVG